MTASGSSADALLEQQTRRESNARTYPRSLPLAIERAEGAIVEDVDGNEYIDCLAGAGTLALGHNHPAIVERLEELFERDRAMHTLDLTTPIKERFVDRLLESLPDEFAESAKVQFCSPAGTDAVEAAMKLVKTATGNRSMVAFQGAYHGMTRGALELMGDTAPREPIAGHVSDVHHAPYPYAYRCPFGLGGGDCWQTSAEYVERTLSNPDSGIVDPAGMILEPVQGEGGVVPAPDEWLRAMRRITREHDIPLIVDEIQTGLGRTGELYAVEHADVVPDVLTLSKAIGGGLPVSVVVYDESLDIWEPGAHAGTFRGNQLGMAAGAATIEYVLEHDLETHAAAMGERLQAHLEETAGTFEAVGDVRGRGLMVGMELVDPDGETDSLGRYPADGNLASAVQTAAFERGLIVETGGRHGSVVRLLPPLSISPSQIDDVGDIVYESVRSAHSRGRDRAETRA
ncbi:diaminobutyrate--2-oxoglutarate transaminase [Natrinema halophilum]|uniref:Diaminobutyrate--2-oxoglutarate transaminase n=1 Tax=Natrinema halophilum TaxID=1699371 RepID=A0A7D5L3H6_9EURY|nr:diaminobutyrate--2-oxoglutarate transaminase [Natrinema halophilum]QLG49965.1 diaminobutyrate--2-oxoglutarate transaminase [Natrinema halophilum]